MNPTLAVVGAALVVVASGAACTTNNASSTNASTTSAQSAEAPSANQAMTPNVLSSDETAAGWRLLFDGKTTSGWREFRKQSVSPGWQVIGGSLVRADSAAGDIITTDQFRNFELALDWKVPEAGNSGIFYRATEQADIIWQAAPEMQVLDDAKHVDGRNPLTSAGASYAIYPAPRGAVRAAGEWNSARLIVNGNHVEHWLNGTKMVEFELGGADWKDRVAKSKFNTMPMYGTAKEGHIGLQDHGDRVEFRNIRIRVLP